jgi:regulator of replication initiation timing
VDNYELGVDPNTDMEAAVVRQKDAALLEYITGTVDPWRTFREQEYERKFAQYERLARGVWSEEDRSKMSERSRLITPLTMQAIRTVTDEVDEAVINSGDFGTLTTSPVLTGREATVFGLVREEFRRRLAKDGWRTSLSEAIQVAATYGSAFGELEMEEVTEHRVTAQGNMVGSEAVPRTCIKPRIWSPRNVLVDWNATDIQDSQGIAFEELVPKHLVSTRIAEGVYRSVTLGVVELDADRNPNPDQTIRNEGVEVIRWYGKVPKHLLEDSEGYAKAVMEENTSGFTEAIVHIVNNQIALAAANPTMRQNRGVEHYPFEHLPGRLLGRGIAEAGLNMQAAADAVVRAHMDSLAVTSVPMTATDITRFPRGFNFAIQAGRNIGVNGPVTDAIQRINMGSTDPMLLATGQTFERLFMQATGTLDSGVLPDLVKGGTDPTALMIAMAALIRRNRQRVMNFQYRFLIPLLEETYYRLVQLEPDAFPAIKASIEPVGTVGSLEREFETGKLHKILQTLGPTSPLVPLLMEDIVAMSNSRSREKLQGKLAEVAEAAMKKAQSDDGQASREKMDQMKFMADLENVRAQVQKTLEEAHQLQVETELLPRRTQAEFIAALSKNIREGGGDDAEFQKRARIAELMFKERELDQKDADRASNEKITQMQNGGVDHSESYAELKKKLDDLKGTLDAPSEFIMDEEGNITGSRKRVAPPPEPTTELPQE